MDEQRARARKAQKKSVIEVTETRAHAPTNFLGYEHDHTGADVQEILEVGGCKAIILNNSVLYAEMGGTGWRPGRDNRRERFLEITDTRKAGESWIHLLADEIRRR